MLALLGLAVVALAALGAYGWVAAVAVLAIGGLTIAALRWSVDVVFLLGVALLYGNVTVALARHVGASTAVAGVVPYVVMVAALLGRRPRRGGGLRLPLAPLLLAIIGANLVSTLVAQAPASQLEALGSTLTFVLEGVVLVVVVVNAVTTWRLLHLTAWAVALTAGALGALSTYQALTGRYDETFFGLAVVNEVIWQDGRLTGVPRLAGSIGEKNFYALMLLAALPLIAYLVTRRTAPLGRLVAGALLLTTSFGLAATYSRGAMVAAGAVIVVLAAIGFLPRRVLVAAVLGTIVLFAVAPELRNRLGDLADVEQVVSSSETGSTDLAVEGRYASLVAAADTFRTHPVLGVGPGQEKYFYLDVAQARGIFVHSEPREAHNLVLSIAASQGLVGLVLHGVLFGATAVAAVRQRRRVWADRDGRALGTAVVTALALVLVGSMFLSLNFVRYLYLPVALCLAYSLLRGPVTPFARARPAGVDRSAAASVAVGSAPSRGGAHVPNPVHPAGHATTPTKGPT